MRKEIGGRVELPWTSRGRCEKLRTAGRRPLFYRGENWVGQLMVVEVKRHPRVIQRQEQRRPGIRR